MKNFYDAVHPMAIKTMSAFLGADRYDIIHDHTGAIAVSLGACRTLRFCIPCMDRSTLPSSGCCA